MLSTKFNKYVERLYTDKFTILRYIDIQNEDGSTKEVLDENPVLKDIPCKISLVKEDEHKDKEDINPELVKFKIFCSPNIELKKGDKVIAKKYLDQKVVDVIEGISSRSVKYNINQEFILIKSGEA